MRVAVMVLLLLLLSVPAARAERVLRVAYTDDVATFDPDDAIILYGLDAARVLYEGLVQYRPGSTEIEGWLAESWTVSPDGLTYSFRLRDGIVFHDGRPLTAAAVLAYFERRRNPTFPLSYFLDNVQAMAAPDARTFVITLKQPEPAFLDRLASPWAPKVIGPEALIDHAGSDFAVGWLNDHADGTGPFLLAEMVRGQRYVLVRNPRYWGPPPWFDRIEILIVPTINQQMLMLARGELDIVEHGYPFDQLDRLPPGVVADAHDVLGLEMAYLNPAKALADPAVRRAVMTMLDPARWLHDLFGSYATPAKSLYPKAMIEGPAPVVFPNDLEAARRAVRAHGPVSLEIGYSDQEAPVQQQIAETFVSLLKEIGIDATVRSVPIDQEIESGQRFEAITGYLHRPELSRRSPPGHPDRRVLPDRRSSEFLRFFRSGNRSADRRGRTDRSGGGPQRGLSRHLRSSVRRRLVRAAGGHQGRDRLPR